MGYAIGEDEVAAFKRDGYLMIRGLFDEEEIRMMSVVARGDDAIQAHAYDVEDVSGNKTKLTLWNHPSDDIFGMVARCHRVVDTAERLLDDEVYHYHSKLSMKEPKVGGAWEWHQDYGYWYENGCLFPDMLSCMIALDPATRENGCMQLLKGSHRLGRIDHTLEGEQTGADKDRVAEVAKVCDLVYAEMDPGDAMFFHSNTLHCSAPNESEDPRWGLICCYNARSNNPCKEHHHPCYTPLEKVPDTAVKECDVGAADSERTYIEKDEDDANASGRRQTTQKK